MTRCSHVQDTSYSEPQAEANKLSVSATAHTPLESCRTDHVRTSMTLKRHSWLRDGPHCELSRLNPSSRAVKDLLLNPGRVESILEGHGPSRLSDRSPDPRSGPHFSTRCEPTSSMVSKSTRSTNQLLHGSASSPNARVYAVGTDLGSLKSPAQWDSLSNTGSPVHCDFPLFVKIR